MTFSIDSYYYIYTIFFLILFLVGLFIPLALAGVVHAAEFAALLDSTFQQIILDEVHHFCLADRRL
jgi:hypothetical protein